MGWLSCPSPCLPTVQPGVLCPGGPSSGLDNLGWGVSVQKEPLMDQDLGASPTMPLPCCANLGRTASSLCPVWKAGQDHRAAGP